MMKRLLIALFSPLAFAADYPETVVTPDYTFPPLGQYSVPGVGQAIHADDAPSVTLGNGETLTAAAVRLKVVSGGQGGRIKIPWDTDTVQCDKIRTTKMPAVSITGIPGPGGKLPRFYCLRVEQGGTIPKDGPGGVWAMAPASQKFLVEQVEIAGYTKWVQAGGNALTVIRNAIFYGAMTDGFGNASGGPVNPITTDVQFAGVKVYNGGQGNASHCFYMHRGNAVSPVSVTLVDSEVASCNWSSGFKSIANINRVSGNAFYTYKDVPGLPRRYSQMMVDIASCSDTVVEKNAFYADRPNANTPGGAIIGVRNRRGIFGCDTPPGWTSETIRLPDGRQHNCTRNPTIPECKLPNSDFWKDSYWSSLGGVKTLPFHIRLNRLDIKPGSFKADRTLFVESEGSYPNYTYTLGGWDCPLPVADTWYERSMTYVSHNTYSGVINKNYLFVSTPAGWGHPDKCAAPPPSEDRRDRNLITVGAGEVYQ